MHEFRYHTHYYFSYCLLHVRYSQYCCHMIIMCVCSPYPATLRDEDEEEWGRKEDSGSDEMTCLLEIQIPFAD